MSSGAAVAKRSLANGERKVPRFPKNDLQLPVYLRRSLTSKAALGRLCLFFWSHLFSLNDQWAVAFHEELTIYPCLQDIALAFTLHVQLFFLCPVLRALCAAIIDARTHLVSCARRCGTKAEFSRELN